MLQRFQAVRCLKLYCRSLDATIRLAGMASSHHGQDPTRSGKTSPGQVIIKIFGSILPWSEIAQGQLIYDCFGGSIGPLQVLLFIIVVNIFLNKRKKFGNDAFQVFQQIKGADKTVRRKRGKIKVSKHNPSRKTNSDTTNKRVDFNN